MTDLGEEVIRARAAGETFDAIAARLGVKVWKIRRDLARAVSLREAQAEARAAAAAGRPEDAPLLSAGLTKRACNALIDAGYVTVGDVAAETNRRVRLAANIGPAMLADIRAVIPRSGE